MKFEKPIKLNDIFDRNLFILNDNEDLCNQIRENTSIILNLKK